MNAQEQQVADELRALALDHDDASVDRVVRHVQQYRRRRTVTRSLLGGALVAALAVGGLSVAGETGLFSGRDQGDQPIVASECTPRIRMNGTVYELYTSTQGGRAEQTGTAELSTCDDMGPEPGGPQFPANPELVDAWSLGAFDPAQVLGVRSAGGSYRIFIAIDTPPQERERIAERLG